LLRSPKRHDRLHESVPFELTQHVFDGNGWPSTRVGIYDGDQLLAETGRTTTKPIARFKVRKPEPPRQRHPAQGSAIWH
jgi:hypothetical protein